MHSVDCMYNVYLRRYVYSVVTRAIHKYVCVRVMVMNDARQNTWNIDRCGFYCAVWSPTLVGTFYRQVSNIGTAIHFLPAAARRMTSGDDLRPIAAATCPPASRHLHSSSAVEKVDGGVTVWGITIGSNCQIALPVFGTLFLAVGIVLTGILKPRTSADKTQHIRNRTLLINTNMGVSM